MRNDRLRGVFERLGFEHVRSVISSGNIVFASPDTDVPALESRIPQTTSSSPGTGRSISSSASRSGGPYARRR